MISKLLQDLIEPEVDKLDTHDRVDVTNSDVKIDGTSWLQFCSNYLPNTHFIFKIFIFSY